MAIRTLNISGQFTNLKVNGESVTLPYSQNISGEFVVTFDIFAQSVKNSYSNNKYVTINGTAYYASSNTTQNITLNSETISIVGIESYTTSSFSSVVAITSGPYTQPYVLTIGLGEVPTKVLVDKDFLEDGLTDICDSIRAKTGGTADLAFPNGIAEAINGISGGKTETTKFINPNFSSGNIIVTATNPSTETLSQVTIYKPTDLLPENIKNNVNIAGIVGTYQGGGLSPSMLNDSLIIYLCSSSKAPTVYINNGDVVVLQEGINVLNPRPQNVQVVYRNDTDTLAYGLLTSETGGGVMGGNFIDITSSIESQSVVSISDYTTVFIVLDPYID